MHKKIKLFVSMLAAAATLVLLPDSGAMTAKAAGNTYSLKYLGGEINNWCYVPGSTFDEALYPKGVDVLKVLDLQNGDNIVVYPGEVETYKDLDLSGFKLNSLTVHQNTKAAVITDGINECYILAGAYTAINGDVTSAHLYDNTTCTFNNNVLDMVLHYTDTPQSNISCVGTVGCFQFAVGADDPTGGFYDIPKGTMKLQDGTIQFPVWYPTPSEAYLQAKGGDTTSSQPGTDTPAETPATPAPEPTPSVPAAGGTSDEYDKVPKTGEDNHAALLAGLAGTAALLFTASFCLYRKTN